MPRLVDKVTWWASSKNNVSLYFTDTEVTDLATVACQKPVAVILIPSQPLVGSVFSLLQSIRVCVCADEFCGSFEPFYTDSCINIIS